MIPITVFQFSASQLVAATLDEVWRFFSSPGNLATLTPPEMGFEILSPIPREMQPGLIIRYRVKPLWGIPVQWVTEITHVEPLRFFVDEQRFGPYRFWHHLHTFEPQGNGVLVSDLVHYAVAVPPSINSLTIS
ncbi:MAG: SRPBCC family protein [Candidatus Sumerlaeaceae bacterium]|nr:SRPBCC family protein [Candidatus Sumerlaeaceae bacterium]